MSKLKKIKNFLKTGLKNLMRSFNCLNELENGYLSEELSRRMQSIKEHNSKIVFEAYYMPKAAAAILREDNYLASAGTTRERAVSMMLYDKAAGVLDEFYKFTD